MTKQKELLTYLVNGHHIVGSSRFGYRVLTPDHSPVLKVTATIFNQVRWAITNSEGIITLDENFRKEAMEMIKS